MNNPSRFQKFLRAVRIIRAELAESFYMALDALIAHRLRSSLTVVGVLAGVFSILLTMTAMQVLQGNIQRELQRFGGQTFVVQKLPAIHFGGPAIRELRLRENITFAQAEELAERAVLPANIGVDAGLVTGEFSSPYGETPPTVRVRGITPGTMLTQNLRIAEGRAITQTDIESDRDVAVLGHAVAMTLFPFGGAVGGQISFQGARFTVIGVLEPKGAMLGGEDDNSVLIPVTTGFNRYGRRDQSLSIYVQARSAESYGETVDEVRGILRTIRKVPPGQEDDFELFSSDSIIRQFERIATAVRFGVAGISSIALLAAGIGIMNIMLVSVTERTREIGIRRAVGARKRGILMQFTMEAVVLCQVGGVLGVLLGIAGGNALAYVMDVPPAIPVNWAIIGLVACSAVGILFGIYPAVKAANLDPIEALRHE